MVDSTRTRRGSEAWCIRPSPRRHSTKTYSTNHHKTCSLGQRITKQDRYHQTESRKNQQGDHQAHLAPLKSRKESKLNFLYRKLKMRAYRHWTKEVTFSNSRFRWLKVLQDIKEMLASVRSHQASWWTKIITNLIQTISSSMPVRCL